MQRLKVQFGLIAGVVALALPSAAPAQRVVPPGNSAVNQYTETFPTAKGPAATKGQRADRSPGEALGPRNTRRLGSEGPAGQELAAVVAATAPPGARSGAAQRIDVGDSSALAEIVRQASGSSDSGGMGVALPLLILAAVLGFALYAWRRRRLAA